MKKLSDKEKRIKQLFHLLWGKAVGSKEYDKKEWIELQLLLNMIQKHYYL